MNSAGLLSVISDFAVAKQHVRIGIALRLGVAIQLGDRTRPGQRFQMPGQRQRTEARAKILCATPNRQAIPDTRPVPGVVPWVPGVTQLVPGP